MTNEKIYDVSSLYPQVDNLDYGKLYVGNRETKSLANEIYNAVYNQAIDDVLEKLKREVNQHHRFGIEGFKVGMCHSRILIEGMKRE